VATLWYLVSNLPFFWYLPSHVAFYAQLIYIFAAIESIIAVCALFVGIKEKNRTAIVLASLLLVLFLKPFLSEIIVILYRNFYSF